MIKKIERPREFYMNEVPSQRCISEQYLEQQGSNCDIYQNYIQLYGDEDVAFDIISKRIERVKAGGRTNDEIRLFEELRIEEERSEFFRKELSKWVKYAKELEITFTTQKPQ